MSQVFYSASGVLGWLLRSSLQAGVLVLLIIAVQFLFRRALSPKWRAALWFLLLIRLILPWGPESRASVFNMVPWLVERAEPTAAPVAVARAVPAPDFTPAPAAVAVRTPVAPPQAPRLIANDIVTGAWGLGMALVFLSACYTNFRLLARLRRVRPVMKDEVTLLLESCKKRMGVRVPVSVVETDQVAMPSLLGFVRPRILLPEKLLASLRPEQLEFVFLHELAHIKRRDIALGWLAVAVQALHWFNPLVWYVFHRMRADRELACDAAVLSCKGQECSIEYGRTLIALLERPLAPPRLLPVAGLIETQAQLKRRITMIARFKKNSLWLSAAAMILVLALAVATLTNAVQETAQAQPQAPATQPPPAARPGLPDYVPATSTIGIDGRIVDKMDWPFVDDPAVLGTWKSVDFVKEQGDFKPTWMPRMPWKVDLYLKELTFLPNGRMQQGWYRWTKGLLLHDGDRTAEVYTIKEFNGEPYMFLEWKSGDYVIRKMKPQYYVLKKDLTAPAPNLEGTAAMTDEAFRAAKKPAVEQLVRDVDTDTRESIVAALGEPFQYICDKSIFDKDSLPDVYLMQYPDQVDFVIYKGGAREIRFYKPGYIFANGIQVGSTVDEVVTALGQPQETVVGQKNEFKDGILYKDVDGRKGICYYQRNDKDVRCFFIDYKVCALYMTRSDY